MDSMQTTAASGMTRRGLVFTAATFVLGAAAGASGALFWAGRSRAFSTFMAERRRAALNALVDRVVPGEGREIAVSLGDSIARMVAAGVIAPEKFEKVYAKRGGAPDWVTALFTAPSAEPIVLSLENARYLLNLLWPLGLANMAAFNEDSPIKGEMLARFASTGGWTLGKASNGAEYFNAVPAVPLDESQERTVLSVAQNIYRPCCNNSTFFQDCNHGSAMLGLLELAASQGAGPEEMYEMALAANAYWYPSQYVEIALYFEEIERKRWAELDPSVVLGEDHSSYTGWKKNIHAALSESNLVPGALPGGSAGCAV